MKQKTPRQLLLSRNIILIIFLGVILQSNIISCGISDVPSFLPASISVTTPGVIAISHNTKNTSDSFAGYEVYYKLYLTDNITTISSDRSYITDTIRKPTPSIITGRKFRKLIPVSFNGAEFTSLEFSQVPLLKPANKSSSITYYIDFSAGTAVYSGNVESSTFISGSNDEVGYQALLLDNANTTFIHRQFNNNSFNSFFDTKINTSYSVSDNDISSMIGSDFDYGDELLIVLAVLPYGIDFNATQRVYGDIVVSSNTTFDYTRRAP